MKRRLYGFVILLMLAAQLAVAQHATVHFDAHAHAHSHEHAYEQNAADADHDNHTGDHPAKAELCDICIFAKGFGHSLTPQSHIMAAFLPAISFDTAFTNNIFSKSTRQNHLIRGPPAFLI